MYKIFSLIIVVLLFLGSCNNATTITTQATNLDSLKETENKVEQYKDPNFPIINFQKLEFVAGREAPKTCDFLANFTMQNNTSYRITNFNIEAKILLKFKDEDIISFPSHNRKGTSHFGKYKEDDFVCYSCTFDLNDKVNTVNVEHPWENSTNKTYDFIVNQYANSLLVSIDNELFERTPEMVNLLISYKAMGVDGEYKNKIKYDILDKWKDYQTKIGLRGNNSNQSTANSNTSDVGINETNTNSPEAGTYIVNASNDIKVYFHTSPDKATVRRAYIDSPEKVVIKKIENGFGYLEFVNDKGQVTTGWLDMQYCQKSTQ